ncbi:MAG: potassium-dependent mechanosensitive channel [Alphaproteobacteria bacterium]|nr:potassium-dependent mechanosensitive channel [Alphaproteobacteria bacterium]
MAIGRIQPGLWRQFVLWTLTAALLLATVGFERKAWAEAGEEPSIEELKKSLDGIEAAVDSEDITAETLAGFRDKLNSATDILRKKIDWLEPRAKEAEDRLKELGPAPAKDAPAESAEIAGQRKELTDQFNDVDGELKQARVLTVKTDQLGDRVAQKRHALYANELFARSASILDPSFWTEVYRALPIELRSIEALVDAWSEHHTRPRWAGAALIIVVIIAIVVVLTRWWLPRMIGEPSNTRSAKAWAALWVFIWFAIRTPLAGFAALLALTTFGLLTVRLEQIAQGVVAGMAAAAFGHGVARGLLAPEHPHRRLVQEDDETALCFYNHLLWASRALGVLIVLQVIHKTLFAPLVITVATNALFAATTAAFLVHLVLRLGTIKKNRGEALVAASWAHPLGLLMAVLIGIALVAGYAGVAAFISLRVIVAAAVFGALFLLLVITQTLFASINEQTPKGQMLAESLGIDPRTLGLSGALLSALIRVILIATSFLLIIGPWEVSTADLFDTVRNIPFGFKIGEIRVSFQAILAAILVLVLLLVFMRIIQRWLERELLPRTGLEPSLQLSIVTIFGYVGAITAIALALSGLGFDLQKIALIAGALSVGIGFGLQSIVSNFVSGLILLTERPIRVGDSIVVKGEEGWVRRVRVRATEIETFDRASVIIPNSEFITGVVKNWTRANRLGRIVVKVGVSYETDPDRVRDILTDIANAHPQIVQTPPPAAYLVAFGETQLEFELRCVVAEVEKGLSVRSELHYAIIQKFREAGIGRFGPKTGDT